MNRNCKSCTLWSHLVFLEIVHPFSWEFTEIVIEICQSLNVYVLNQALPGTNKGVFNQIILPALYGLYEADFLTDSEQNESLS